MSYYQTLNVSETANQEEIKQAYRKLAKKFHPDKNPNQDTKQRFQNIQEAYQILGDETKRREYDQRRGGEMDWESLFQQWNGGASNWANDFNQHFGNRDQYSKGRDQRVTIQLDIHHIYNGFKTSLNTGIDTAPIDIPKGAKEGMTFRIKGRGAWNQWNREAPRGDLLVQVTILPNVDWIIQGDDIWMEVSLKWYDMILGVKTEIETPTGKLAFTVPSGSNPGKVLRLAGKGLPIMGTNQSGAILIKLFTSFAGLNSDQIELINRIKQLEN